MASTGFSNNEFHFSSHALARLAERGLDTHDVFEAAADGVSIMRAGGYREFRGRNGVSFILSSDGVVVTVLPRGARTFCRQRAGSGSNRHRRGVDGRRRPPKRPQDLRPGSR
jgi:hypothetical protein